MTPDVIVAWPKSADYPLWRQFIANNRQRFAKVIVVFTDHHGQQDYSGWLRENFPDVTCLDSDPSRGTEWRDAAVNTALDVSDSEWVWFTEQDFLIDDPGRFWRLKVLTDQADAMGWREHNERVHPSCLFVRRATIEATTRRFDDAITDHFYRFGREIEAVGRFMDLRSGPLLLRPGLDFHHLQGTSDNHRLLDAGDLGAIFKPDQFREYLRASLTVTPLNPAWEAQVRAYLD